MSQFSYDELKNLFDKDKVHFYQSSLGILELEGKDCEKFLNSISTNDSSMKIQHNLILTNKGRILFDMSIFNQEKIYVITNALQVQDLIDYLNKYKMSYQVNIENLSDKFIALKGTHLKINNNMIWKSPIFLEEDLDVAIVDKDYKLPESKKIGEDFTLVKTVLVVDKEEVSISYLLLLDKNKWRIFDVLLAGSISEIATKKSEFSGFLRDGKITPLIDALKKKNAVLND